MYQKKSSLSGRRGLGSLGVQSCTVDPITNARVCSDDSAGTSPTSPNIVPAIGCSGNVTPRYLKDPTAQNWAWNVLSPATWIFTGRPDPNSVYDTYTRADNGAFAAVGPGGGFIYDSPMRSTVPAYSACPSATPAQAPATPAPMTATGTGIIPMPMYTPSPAGSGFSLSSIPSWAKYGGMAAAALFAVKLLMPGGRR
ncbi:MAG: hypothetical protein ACJ71W_05940 [Terriglobales bacterium]